MFLAVNRLGKELEIGVIAIVEDSDSSLRKLQYGNYTYFSSKYQWHNECEFPLLLGLGKLKSDLPLQEVVQVVKKFRNNLQYPSIRILLF